MSGQQSAGEKTEQPTASRLRKARQEGQLARSKDFTSGVLLLAAAATLDFSTQLLIDGMAQITQLNMLISHEQLKTPGMLVQLLGQTILALIQMLVPVLSGLYLCTAIAATLPEGPVFNPASVAFKFDRISLLSGFGRIFSINSIVELGKSILKVALVCGIMWGYLQQVWDTLPMLARQPLVFAIERGAEVIIQGLYYLGAGVAFIGLIDLPYQAWSHKRKLKMTKQEVKEEHKQQEGKPEVKARIRQIQQKMARSRAEVALPKADVLLVNPTHYAVALKYEPDRVDAPYVIAKGVDEVALYMRSLAPKYDLEVISAPPLTRAIYHSTQIEQQIPAALYQAIAHVLNYVLQLKAFRNGKQARPAPLPNFHIPDHLRHK
ncbi:flagellar biosynthesis protein FlhB [Ferrimonas aestuarii]|uniref:Flagellar biosynthetic protein FlhB n=1 Tax=Ferrimonas aestuarii TaxID=2569539 RepID=A0A4U1BN95_9GAMM|nr:flagellar biosynthesis protein FlhB [Ferrimonas aestuarii]TKB54563.1 flagellar biosynthesis protein FlhB [Ferrimonas aestuarii]